MNDKILLVMSIPPPYHGANVANHTLWESRIQEVFNCIILDISDKRDINNLGKLDFVNVKLALKSLWDFFRLLRKEKPDLVYILVSQNNLAYLRDGLFIFLAKLFSNAKVVIHLHGGYFDKLYKSTNIFMKKFIDLTMRRVDTGIVYSRALEHTLNNWVKDLCHVPNGIDFLSDLNLNNKLKKNKKFAKITVCYLSNLIKSKGIIDLIESAVEVTKSYQNVSIKIAGSWGNDPFYGVSSGELKQEAMSLVESNNLDGYLEFIGIVKGQAKEQLLLESDIFVLPTYYPAEGHPVSIVEAMAAGCPVISTRQGAIPDTVLDGKTGYLIEARNPGMLADRLKCLIHDEGLRVRMSILSHKRYEKLYTKECFIENMICVFNRILGK